MLTKVVAWGPLAHSVGGVATAEEALPRGGGESAVVIVLMLPHMDRDVKASDDYHGCQCRDERVERPGATAAAAAPRVEELMC